MKKIMNWVLAATLTMSGASVFTSCSTDNGDNPAQEQAKKNRKEFVAHTRSVLKDLAENLNFEVWELGTQTNLEFNEEVLNNPEFDKTITTMFSQKVRESMRPVEAGSELAEKGYKYVGTVDFTAFNYRFTQRLDLTGFDVEEADDFEMVLQDDEWEPGKIYCTRLLLKAGGGSQELLSRTLSNDTVAVVMLIPETFEISLTSDFGTTSLEGQFQNKLQPVSGSQYAVLSESQWTISGTLTGDAQENWEGETAKDIATTSFSITQNPATHKSDVDFCFEQNGRKMLELSATNTNSNGKTDLSHLASSSSIIDLIAAVAQGNSIDDLRLTLLDDLTTSMKVSDCQKVMQVEAEMNKARRSYADQQTMNGYAEEMNKLISFSTTCKGVNQEIPMRIATAKVGVDWWVMPALNFANENGYTPLTDLLDKESIEYGINIIDHAAEPMQQSIIVVRQLVQFLETMFVAANVQSTGGFGAKR